jgi:hypothetical protein
VSEEHDTSSNLVLTLRKVLLRATTSHLNSVHQPSNAK